MIAQTTIFKRKGPLHVEPLNFMKFIIIALKEFKSGSNIIIKYSQRSSDGGTKNNVIMSLSLVSR